MRCIAINRDAAELTVQKSMEQCRNSIDRIVLESADRNGEAFACKFSSAWRQ